MPNPTPEPKPLDAERLKEMQFAFRYQMQVTGQQCQPLFDHINAQASIIAALTAELAERGKREAELVEAANDLLGNYECFIGISLRGSVSHRLKEAIAALAPFSTTEQGDG